MACVRLVEDDKSDEKIITSAIDVMGSAGTEASTPVSFDTLGDASTTTSVSFDASGNTSA